MTSGQVSSPAKIPGYVPLASAVLTFAKPRVEIIEEMFGAKAGGFFDWLRIVY